MEEGDGMRSLGYYNGEIGVLEEMRIPMNDRACWFGDGVYDAHLCRNKLGKFQVRARKNASVR